MKHLRLATTDYGRNANKPWRTRLLWLADHAAAYVEIATAFVSGIALWSLAATACAIAVGWLEISPLGAMFVGLWIGFAAMIWTASLRRIRARARRELRRQLNMESHDDHAA